MPHNDDVTAPTHFDTEDLRIPGDMYETEDREGYECVFCGHWDADWDIADPCPCCSR